MLFDEMDDDDFLDSEDSDLANLSSSAEPHFKDPRHIAHIVGQADIERQLHDILSGARPPQGLIFTGAMGVGKATMAFRVARYLLQQRMDTGGLFGDPEPLPADLSVPKSDPVFHLIASGGHPDLLTIERQVDEKTDRRKAALSVEELRKIAPFLRKTASVEGGWRVVIVDDADTMTRSSQNALLKILEEPPPRALLILITHKLSSLLPTILSRVQVISFPNLSDAELKSSLRLSNSSLSDDQLDLVTMMAEGSLGRALTYARSEQLELISNLHRILSALPHVQWTSVQDLAAALGAKESEDLLKTFQDVVVNYIRLRVKAVMLSQNSNPEPYFKALDAVQSSFAKGQLGNLDKKITVLEVFDILAGLPV